MGMMTEYQIYQIEAFRKKCGIEVPNPETQRLLRQLQEQCFEVIKIAELEISGIRDGDGAWHGSDVVRGFLSHLKYTSTQLARAYGIEEPDPDLALKQRTEIERNTAEIPW